MSSVPVPDFLAARESELQSWEEQLMEKQEGVDRCMHEIKEEASRQLASIQRQQHDVADRLKAVESRENAVLQREQDLQRALLQLDQALQPKKTERHAAQQPLTTAVIDQWFDDGFSAEQILHAFDAGHS